MRTRECEVSSPDVSLHFLEPCIRTQTSTSWMIRSAQQMQESAGTYLNSEFAPVFYHLCFPGTLSRSGKRAQESLCASGDSAHSSLVFLPPLPSLHRSIIEKFCTMMRSGQENTAGASSLCRTVGSVLQGVRDTWQIPPLLALDGSRHCGWIQTPGIRRMM